jgi:hypothetical protein
MISAAYAFLSYSRKDQGLVDSLAAYLTQEEIPRWIDNQLEFGETWEDTITQRIRGCKVFLVAMSPRAAASEYVPPETDLALSLHKLIIPILIDGEPFAHLNACQFVKPLDTDSPKTRFVERLRDLLAPGQIPGEQVQRRRVEHFAPATFEEILGCAGGTRTMLGIGFDRAFNVSLEEKLDKLDELEWIEVFQILRERLPNRDFRFPVGTDFAARFPTIGAFSDFLLKSLRWEEIRRL